MRQVYSRGQRAHDRCLLERVTAVLAVEDVRLGALGGQGDEQPPLAAAVEPRARGDLHLHGHAVPLHRRAGSERDGGGPGRRTLDLGRDQLFAAARKLDLAVDDHLRGVDATERAPALAGRRPQPPGPHVVRLPPRERLRRERIAPAEVVPVVDVEGERHDLVPAEPARRQTADDLVRRRTRAAPLRREQLDQHDAVPRGGRGASGPGRAGQREHRNEQT